MGVRRNGEVEGEEEKNCVSSSCHLPVFTIHKPT